MNISSKVNVLFNQCGECVFVPNERRSYSEQACFISHMQLCSSLKHTYSHTGEAVESQQES